MLAKLVNGTLRYAPKKIYIDNQLIFNPTEAQLKEQGYKEVENTESPTILTKTQTVVSSFVEQEDKIVQQWEVKLVNLILMKLFSKFKRNQLLNK